jgi:3-dehydroquinate synthase
VLCDTDELATLPDAEVRGGMAEIVKCGFIADPSILDDVESNPGAALDPHGDLLTSLIVRGIQVKADTVAVDLKEASGAALGGDGSIGREALNYGHTLGHAIERHTYFACSHGEAISVGMVFAAELAHDSGLIDSRLLARHRAILDRVGLPTGYSAATLDEMLDAMALDKKTRAGTLRFVVLDALANPVILEGPDAALLRRAFDAVSAGPSSVVGGAR